MEATAIDYRVTDREIWEQELADFVPERMLDAHIHFFWNSNLANIPAGFVHEDHNLATLNDWARVLYPGRQLQYLIPGTPSGHPVVERHVESVRQEITGIPGIRHNRLVTPGCQLDDIERDLQNKHLSRLRAKVPESYETSRVHQETLRMLKSINTAFTMIGYDVAKRTQKAALATGTKKKKSSA